ncbi:hypothetical protein OH77DRAFT_1427141 [Trametes cingulata]|nr:hypothetical protein OH77DRAFT_1427141 [Trametes cingulata]
MWRVSVGWCHSLMLLAVMAWLNSRTRYVQYGQATVPPLCLARFELSARWCSRYRQNPY